jgi:hypothetical protein
VPSNNARAVMRRTGVGGTGGRSFIGLSKSR